MSSTGGERESHRRGRRRWWLFILIVVGLIAASALLSHDHRLMDGPGPPTPLGSDVRLFESGPRGSTWRGPTDPDVHGAARA